MMYLLYSLISWIGFLIILPVLALLNRRTAYFLHERRKNLSHLETFAKSNNRPVLWFHASSHGEFEQIRPIIREMKDTFQDRSLVLTVFSPSGFEVARLSEEVDLVTYLPLDIHSRVNTFMDLLKPTLAIIVKYDFWPVLLQTCFRKDIPVVYVGSRFRKDQFYFKVGRSLYLPLFKRISHFFVLDQASKDLLLEYGIENVTISGDTRMDRVLSITQNQMDFPEIPKFLGDRSLMVLGSVWEEDIDRLEDFIKRNPLKLKFIIAPHDVGKSHVQRIISSLGGIRWTQWQKDRRATEIIVLDTIGMLSSIYSFAKYAYVGGAFTHGLHNILEPAAFGIPVFFGKSPRNKKYPEAEDMETSGGAKSISEGSELKTLIGNLEENDGLWQEMGTNAGDFIKSRSGASSIVLSHLKERWK